MNYTEKYIGVNYYIATLSSRGVDVGDLNLEQGIIFNELMLEFYARNDNCDKQVSFFERIIKLRTKKVFNKHCS